MTTKEGVTVGTPHYMSPEQWRGESVDGRSDLYSLGIVTYQMLTGELPFSAPTVAGILMKQITEPAPDLRAKRGDAPEDLALAVTRCLEKDPENRWPSADALRRALESRTVSGYRPTGTGWKSRPAEGQRPGSAPAADRSHGGFEGRPLGGARPLPAPRGAAAPDSRRRDYRGRRDRADELPVPDTGEPRIVQKVRGQFASWAAVSLGCMGINVATGAGSRSCSDTVDPRAGGATAVGVVSFPSICSSTIAHACDHPSGTAEAGSPVRLSLCSGMGLGLLRNYAQLWQAGYSWRDVLSRPAAPDAVETTMVKGVRVPRQLPPPSAEEYGANLAAIQQVQSDRQAILKLMERLPASERKLLPEVQQTVNGLYERATDVARTLHAMDSNLDVQGLAQIEERIAALAKEPDDPERARRLNLLERQRQTIRDLQGRRSQVASHLESCVLAMQNVRFDLLRLRSAGVAAVLSDLTQATQQAKALSRDVDNAIAAAGEIREAMK